MQIRRFSVCSRLALDSLCTICAFDFRPAVFCRIRAVCCCKIHIHSDVITSRIRYGKSNFSIGTVRISNMRVLCFSVRALFTLNALVSLFSLYSLQTLRSLRPLNLRPFVLRWFRGISLGIICVHANVRFSCRIRNRKSCLPVCAIGVCDMQIRRFSVCSRLALDSLCTICAFDFRPAVFCRIRAVCCCKIHIHSDVITSRIRYGKSNFSIGTVRISNMRVLCFSVRALFTLNALVSLFSLDSLQSLRSRISFVAFWSLELRPPVFCRIRAVFFCEIHVLSDISLIYAVRCRKSGLSVRADCIGYMQVAGLTIGSIYTRNSVRSIFSVISLELSPSILRWIRTVFKCKIRIRSNIFSSVLPQLACCRV